MTNFHPLDVNQDGTSSGSIFFQKVKNGDEMKLQLIFIHKVFNPFDPKIIFEFLGF